MEAKEIWEKWSKGIKDFDEARLNKNKLRSAIKQARMKIRKETSSFEKELEENVFWTIFYKCYNIKKDFKSKKKRKT